MKTVRINFWQSIPLQIIIIGNLCKFRFNLLQKKLNSIHIKNLILWYVVIYSRINNWFYFRLRIPFNFFIVNLILYFR